MDETAAMGTGSGQKSEQAATPEPLRRVNVSDTSVPKFAPMPQHATAVDEQDDDKEHDDGRLVLSIPPTVPAPPPGMSLPVWLKTILKPSSRVHESFMHGVDASSSQL